MIDIPSKAPDTIEEFENLISVTVQHENDVYNSAVLEAKKNAEISWDNDLQDRINQELSQIDININSQLDDESNPLSDTDKAKLREEAIVKMNEALEKEKEQFINDSASTVQQPLSEEIIRKMYSFLMPNNSDDYEIAESDQKFDIYNAYYQLDDGRIYSTADADFIKTRDVPNVIKVPGGTLEDLKVGILQFYKSNGYSDVVIPAFMLTEEELFTNLRKERDKRIAETDYLLTQDYPLSEKKRAAITEYRTVLRDLPAMEGSPWDGGGKDTPWPVFPYVLDPEIVANEKASRGDFTFTVNANDASYIIVEVPSIGIEPQRYDITSEETSVSINIPDTIGSGSVVVLHVTAYDNKGHSSNTIKFNVTVS